MNKFRIMSVLMILTMVFSFANPSPALAAGTCVPYGGNQIRCDFAFTGSPDTWTVPAGVGLAHIYVDGARGGKAGSSGGIGGHVDAVIAVVPGQTYQIIVGGAGGIETGGYPNGGYGGRNPYTGSNSYSGGGGGGSSSVKLNSSSILVGGGGGGRGGGFIGGDGGNNGGYGGNGSGFGGGFGGAGGYYPDGNGRSGSWGSRSGNIFTGYDYSGAGGGGGGGYRGGAGGNAGFSYGPGGGGGGGSSYGPDGANFSVSWYGGDGHVTIIYTYTVDTIPPTASPTQSPAANGAGWNNSDVNVSWNWTDNSGGSGINYVNCTTSSVSTSEGNPLTLNATCKDLAGNTGSAYYTLKVDKTNPTISGSRLPVANTNGWNNGDVTVTWSCSDELSGLAVGSPPADTILSGEGDNLSAMGTCADMADNVGSKTVSGVKIDRNAPSTDLMGPTDWTNADVTLTLDPNDSLSGVNATYFILDSGSTQTGTSIAISTEGIHTIEYWSVDNADNVEVHHTAEVKIDKTAPTISHSQSPVANGNGWNNGDVTVTFICGDSLSGIASCTAPQLITTEGQLQDVTGTALDNAGNSAADLATISIDWTAPTISASADRSANTYGWYNNDVLVSFTCEDTLSGIASCPDAQVLGEGSNQSASGTATDAADNLSDMALLSGINVDKTVPTIGYTQSPAANLNGWYNGDVTVTWSCSDALSGLDGDCPTEILISGEGMGFSASASVSDLAGNTATETVSVQIDKTAPIISAIATAGGNPYIPGTWTNQDVTVSFECFDDGSGVGTVTDPIMVSTEGADQSVSGTCTDQAGNSATASVSGIYVDLTGPVLAITTPQLYDVQPLGTALDFSASDPLSGPDGAALATLTDAVGSTTVTSGFEPGIGIYSIVVSATDLAGNTAVSAEHLLVIYDPSGGFVTGGGWIDSPVNADYQYMQVDGKASFGFVAKYNKGANVPDGNTEFQFKAGDLNFHSTSYEWLVVAGNQAMFKGEGTINGQGSYKFMITADDDKPDTFRIKIWYEENGAEVVVYDNGSQQSLGGGSIVVHSK